jgi:hypothetical protein
VSGIYKQNPLVMGEHDLHDMVCLLLAIAFHCPMVLV